MKIRFVIHYHTQWGQQIAVFGNQPELGDGEAARAFLLDYNGDGFWGAELELGNKTASLSYKYLLIDENAGIKTEEWGAPRTLKLPAAKSGRRIIVKDAWREKQHPDNSLYTSAFSEVILRPGPLKVRALGNTGKKPVVQFQIHAPRLEPGHQLCVTGNVEELGNWNADRPLLLGNPDHPLWSGAIALQSGLTIEYKYGIYDPLTARILYLETGENRRIPAAWISRESKLVVTDEYFRHPGNLWRGAGVAMPVFSLRSHQGLGVGEFTDIKLMVDWAREAGLAMVQILPVNDTSATHTWRDSYPYAAISVFALHPLYLNIDALGDHLAGTQQRDFHENREHLNRLPEVDYEAVMNLKLRLSRSIFNTVKQEFLQSAEFKAFFENNSHWLPSYAAFCYLRDKHGTADFKQWGKNATFSREKLSALTDPKAKHYEEIAFHYFLQFHLDKQLREAAQYARENRVILKGDIPIGIYRYSMDAWVEPRLYNMDGQAGAPPDPFSDTGQNWGFPTYNWAEMAKDGYLWWKQRLRQLSRYFDAFRIDHILGFFRIWEIPVAQVEGLMGHFNPALPVTIDEFSQLGIPFVYDRFCKPYIPEHYLYELFGQDAQYVKEHLMEQERPYFYQFRPEYNTQRKIVQFLELPENKDLAHLKNGLLNLLANILFFEVEGSDKQAFHPRIMMKETRSFQDLNQEIQNRLEELYINYFYRRQEEFWRLQAMSKLPAIKNATNMLICGEDLGMVPDCVPGVMRQLNILSLEIQRMSKNPDTEFLSVEDIPYLSVCSPSTHDMSPLRAWWEEMESGQRQRFYRHELGLPGEAPFFCEPFIVEAIIRQHLNWPSMWAVFPLQDLLAIDGALRRENPFDERINVPANPRHYWRYRLHLPIEKLMKENAFNSRVRRMVDSSRSMSDTFGKKQLRYP